MSKRALTVTLHVTVAPDGPLNYPFAPISVEAGRHVLTGEPNLWIQAEGGRPGPDRSWGPLAIILSREDAEQLACAMLAVCMDQREAESPEQKQSASPWPRVRLEALVNGRWQEL